MVLKIVSEAGFFLMYYFYQLLQFSDSVKACNSYITVLISERGKGEARFASTAENEDAEAILRRKSVAASTRQTSKGHAGRSHAIVQKATDKAAKAATSKSSDGQTSHLPPSRPRGDIAVAAYRKHKIEVHSKRPNTGKGKYIKSSYYNRTV